MGRPLVGVLLALVLVAAGCRDAAGEGAPARTEPRRPAVGAAGTAIADGFVVTEGTVLVGAAVPARPGDPQGGWSATLLVEGAPARAVEDYLAQAADAGMAVRVPAGDDAVPCTAEDPDGAVVRCWGVASAGEGAAGLTATVRRGVAEGVPQSHLELVHVARSRPLDPEGLVVGPRAEVPPAPERWPEPSGPGDLLGVDLHDRPRQLRVEEGSREAGPPTVHGVLIGQSVVLEVTGDPDEVLDRYRAQLADTYGRGAVTVQEQAVDGAVVTWVTVAEPGGDHVDLALVERDDETPWIAVTTTHD